MRNFVLYLNKREGTWIIGKGPSAVVGKEDLPISVNIDHYRFENIHAMQVYTGAYTYYRDSKMNGICSYYTTLP